MGGPLTLEVGGRLRYSEPMLPRLLLLQAREPGDPMALHEHECFARALGVANDKITCHDLVAGVPSDEALAEHPLLLIGGSGKYSTLDDDPWLHRFFDWLTETVVTRHIPTFASCFGFQSLVRAGGGAMVRDPARAEVGTFEITLTEQGASDPLLAAFAPAFAAQLGHKDHATRLPAGMSHLAGSALSPFQAARIDGTAIFATQFHPELDREGNEHRYNAYRSGYCGSAADNDDAVLSSMRESPEASSLLPGWLQEVLRQG